MSWKNYKIGDFLFERIGRFKPTEANAKGLKRIEKIDFSGKYYLVDKPTNTDMILVKKGDLLISGINAEKGAVTIYQDEEDALATIHYSSYEFDKNKIDVEYFRWFLKSEAFKNLLKANAGSGIKTELRSKHLLPLEIKLPDLKGQRQIVKQLEERFQKISTLEFEIDQQESYLQLLRQTILQEAVQGKLTKQDAADEHATELLKRIKAEKQKLIKEGKLKKEKELPAITEDEIPFELPKGWVWCKIDSFILDENKDLRTGPFGSSLNKSEHKKEGVPVLGIESISKQGEYLGRNKIFVTETKAEELKSFYVKGGDLILSRSGTIGELCVLPDALPPSLISTNLMKISLYRDVISPTYFCYVIKGAKYISTSLSEFCGGTTRLFITQGILKKLIFPLPPHSEQQLIVAKVQKLLQQLAALETQVQQSRQYAQQLLQALLKEAFEVNKNEYAINEQLTMAAEE